MANENLFFLYAIFMGVFITFVYDILRIFRRVIPHKGFAVSVEDLCFWIYCATEVFLLLNRMSDGMLRWFAVLGAMIGMYVYKKLVSPWYVKYVSLIMGKVVGVVGKILKIVGRPFQKGKEMIGSRWRRIREKSKSRAMRQNMRIKGMLKKKLTFFLKILKMTL